MRMEYNPEFLRKNGIRFCALVKLKSKENIIIYDKLFQNAPENVKKFFIEHEKGHINNSSNKRTLESELKADAYATDILGKAIAVEALLYLWSHIEWNFKTDLIPRLNAVGYDVTNLRLRTPGGKVLNNYQIQELLKEAQNGKIFNFR